MTEITPKCGLYRVCGIDTNTGKQFSDHSIIIGKFKISNFIHERRKNGLIITNIQMIKPLDYSPVDFTDLLLEELETE